MARPRDAPDRPSVPGGLPGRGDAVDGGRPGTAACLPCYHPCPPGSPADGRSDPVPRAGHPERSRHPGRGTDRAVRAGLGAGRSGREHHRQPGTTELRRGRLGHPHRGAARPGAGPPGRAPRRHGPHGGRRRAPLPAAEPRGRARAPRRTAPVRARPAPAAASPHPPHPGLRRTPAGRQAPARADEAPTAPPRGLTPPGSRRRPAVEPPTQAGVGGSGWVVRRAMLAR